MENTTGNWYADLKEEKEKEKEKGKKRKKEDKRRQKEDIIFYDNYKNSRALKKNTDVTLELIIIYAMRQQTRVDNRSISIY